MPLKMSSPAPDPHRRRLLGTVRDVTAAGAVAAVIGPAAATPAAPAPRAAAPAAPSRDRGYHDTDHTRRYYDLARF